MKIYQKIIAIVAAGVACSAITSQASIVLSIDSNSGGGIEFGSNGTGSFSFLGTFNVSGDSSLSGQFTGSPFTFSSPTPVAGGSVSTVSPAGGLSISDGVNTLTATINWVELFENTLGSSGTINDQGVINITGISYSGSDADLQALAASTLGGATLSFSWAPGNQQTLQSLYNTTSPITDDYSGQISSAVPEPTTVAAGALMFLPFGIGALRSLRKDRIA